MKPPLATAPNASSPNGIDFNSFVSMSLTVHVSMFSFLPARSPRDLLFNFMLELHKRIDKIAIFDVRNIWTVLGTGEREE